MKTIKVVSLLDSTSLLSSDKGKVLLDSIVQNLKSSGKKLIIDFSGYEYLSSTLLNHSFGELIIAKNWTMDDLNSNIEIIKLSHDDYEDLELCIFNARQRKKMIDNGQRPEEVYSRYMVT